MTPSARLRARRITRAKERAIVAVATTESRIHQTRAVMARAWTSRSKP